MRKRKTRDVYYLLANYGYGHGWEKETAEYSRAEIKDRLKEYRQNAPSYSYKIVKRREPLATVVRGSR